jgi:hypothetical protein
MQKKTEKTQNQKWKEDITTDITEKKKFTDYYEQLYDNKLDNIEVVDKLLETNSLPTLNQEEIEKS